MINIYIYILYLNLEIQLAIGFLSKAFRFAFRSSRCKDWRRKQFIALNWLEEIRSSSPTKKPATCTSWPRGVCNM